MLSKYELENVILSQSYTPSRKLLLLKSLESKLPNDNKLISEFKDHILNSETENDILQNLEKEEPEHWANFYGRKAACDLLTIGKVQPETMLAMSTLPNDDFINAIKIATQIAKKLNDKVIEVETDIEVNMIPEHLV